MSNISIFVKSLTLKNEFTFRGEWVWWERMLSKDEGGDSYEGGWGVRWGREVRNTLYSFCITL